MKSFGELLLIVKSIFRWWIVVYADTDCSKIANEFISFITCQLIVVWHDHLLIFFQQSGLLDCCYLKRGLVPSHLFDSNLIKFKLCLSNIVASLLFAPGGSMLRFFLWCYVRGERAANQSHHQVPPPSASLIKVI